MYIQQFLGKEGIILPVVWVVLASTYLIYGVCFMHTMVCLWQREGLWKSLHSEGGSVQLSEDGRLCGMGGESVRVRWTALPAACDVQIII